MRGSLMQLVSYGALDYHLGGWMPSGEFIFIGDRALTFILGFRDKKGYKFVRELFNKMHDDYDLLEKWVEFEKKK